MLRVVEQFYSLQGEGARVFLPTYYIRLHGCNLSCKFCDEPLHKAPLMEEWSPFQISKRIPQHIQTVCITGGEPLLQDLRGLCAELRARGFFVQVETNGTVPWNFAHNFQAQFDWVSVSPKEGMNGLTRFEVIRTASEIKLLVSASESEDAVLSRIDEYRKVNPKARMFVQPENYVNSVNKENLKFCILFVLDHPEVGLSVQVHKFLNIK